MEKQKLEKRKKTLMAVMIVPGILLVGIGFYIFTYEGDQDLNALFVIIPLIAVTGIFFPLMQIAKIKQELKNRA